MKSLFVFALLFALSLLSTPAFAGNLSFLKDSALGKLQGKDLEVFQTTLVDLLENKPDHNPVTWENSETGVGGGLSAVKTFQHQGLTCRRVLIKNKIGDTAEKEVFEFCKKGEEWKILSSK